MSPASQGALEVERYIGSCLISSNVRAGLHGKTAVCRKQEQPAIRGKSRGCYSNGQTYPLATAGDQQCQVQYGPGGWTGAPLISMTSSPRRCNQRSSPSLAQQQQQQQLQTCTDQQQQVPPAGHLHKSPLSRLAIHTQGAPLILAGRFYNRGKVHSNNTGNNSNSSPNGTANNTLCGVIGNVAGNYVHSNANPPMTSNANGATRCSASRIVAQRPVEAAPKKAATATSPKSTNPDCPSGAGKESAGSSSIANIDSLSIASDESSGSNNSENSLPRIIKPRKRRKKDRKPLNVVAGGVDAGKPEESQQRQQQQQQQPSSLSTTSSSACIAGSVEPTGGGVLVNAKSYGAGAPCYEPRLYETPPPPPHLRNYRRPPLGHRENAYGGCRAPLMQEAADMRQRYAHHRHAQVKVLDDNRNVVTPMRGAAPPKGYRHYHVAGNVHANGNCGNGNNGSNLSRRYVHEYGDAMTTATAVACEVAARDGMTGACQCRYCDPSGLIWDVDRNGYSPFLTATSGVEYCRGHFGQMPMFLTPPGLQQQQERALDRLFDEHPRSHDDVRDTGGVVLRRSWSDPTSYFSYEEIAAPARDVGVIGDRGQSDSSKRRTPWRGDSIGAPANSPASTDSSGASLAGVASPKGLEVSTEIITSPNGHRDLEIKFYSSPNAPVEREEDKSSSAGDDEDDDFSDIWSYHESKLQQDFRTLLQAEE